MSRTREQMMVPRAEPRTYYDRPVLKKPVWKWYIPAYFFTGGMAGASSTLALAARLRGNNRLARRAGLVSLAGRRRPSLARAGAFATLAGVALTRWSIFKAGFESAEDPRFTVQPQRERIDA